jgi:hypothetical protein
MLCLHTPTAGAVRAACYALRVAHDTASRECADSLLLLFQHTRCCCCLLLPGRVWCCRHTQVGQPQGVWGHHAGHTHGGPRPAATQAAATAQHHAAASSSSSSSGSQQRRQPTRRRGQQCWLDAAAGAWRRAAAIAAADGHDQQQQQCTRLCDWAQEDGVAARLSSQPGCYTTISACSRC